MSSSIVKNVTKKGITMKKVSIRHGELVLKPVSVAGKGDEESVKSYIVAHSETGHHHVVESEAPFSVIKDALGKMWLELEAEAKVIHKKSHDKHDTLILTPGIWEVGAKTEYDPSKKAIARVRD